MTELFFSELRQVASLLDGVETRLQDREALDVDGPQHHALQQAALRNFKTDVFETKARMKTLQPTVVVCQLWSSCLKSPQLIWHFLIAWP